MTGATSSTVLPSGDSETGAAAGAGATDVVFCLRFATNGADMDSFAAGLDVA